MGEPQLSLQELLAVYVRVYEERMLVDIAAEMYANYGYRGGIQRHEIGAVLPGNPDRMLHKLFAKFDEDGSGVLDAKELLAIVRYVNFGKGYCDGCFEPIGEKERGFMCVDCSGYILCVSCYTINQRERFHPPRHQFVAASELLAAQNDSFIPGVGNFLRDATTELFQKMDVDGDGHVTHAEFRQYHRALGYSEPVIAFLLQFDLDGDGRLSKRELLYMTVGLNMARTCDECGGLSFVGQDEMLSCVECTADYDVCLACWNAGRCSHPHSKFKFSEAFQLRTAGLQYEHLHGEVWQLKVGDAALWAKYQPFIGDKVESYAQVK
ncbi:hypothetical protein BBJ28_00005192 [Nothophytophthora sp. Chile5]|nr:hypothetical protein BBJ28_00005192 [Nothophytophthora sp. Chile5]